MNNEFLGEDFLLHSRSAIRLFNEYARDCPILDYHCHLESEDISNNRQFGDLTEIWLEGDHYKWRAMRANGISEKFITGDSSNKQKFMAWAQTAPYTLRNPLYHWTHLELRRYFNIKTLLSAETAEAIYKEANEQLRGDNCKVQSLLIQMNVELVCTSDDPLDDLSHHRKISKSNFQTKVLPTWRADALLAVNDAKSYNSYLDALGEMLDLEIRTFDEMIEAFDKRHAFFNDNGCRLADFGLLQFYPLTRNHSSAEKIFQKLRSGHQLSENEGQIIQSQILYFLCLMNHKRSWAQQFHVGALRNTNPKMLSKLGANSGFDSIGTSQRAEHMAMFMGELDRDDQLCKTIIYNSNPADNYLYASMAGNFQDGLIPGKVQFGASWWFLDQKEGIEKQLNALSNIGLLSRFVGMVTDSRSILSYPRHEYFRRILCNLLGEEMENGTLPNDMRMIGGLVRAVCYENAQTYFEF